MNLSGWKYEGRKISDKLHEQMLDIMAVLNDEKQAAGKNWPALQKDILFTRSEPSSLQTQTRIF